MTGLTQVVAAVAVLANGVLYGFDVFAAVVLRPALGHVDDRALTAVMGNVHTYGDRRLAVPSILGLVAAVATAVVAALAGHGGAAVAGAVAAAAIVAWLALYFRVSVPVNRQLAEAAEAGVPARGAHDLQRRWNSVTAPRTGLQALALAALLAALALT